MKDTLLSIVYGIAVFFLILTFSVATPIYARIFYYAHIEALDLPMQTGYDTAVIKQAYDEVLDYLTLPGKSFSTGELRYSAEGAAHFADCKVLFSLNLIVLLVSAVVLIVLLLLERKRIFRLARPFGMRVSVIPASILLFCMAAIGMALLIDFDVAFTAFHTVLFAGKDNWMFNPQKDQIIRILPSQFFMNCAWLIVSIMVVLCFTIILIQGIRSRNKRTVHK